MKAPLTCAQPAREKHLTIALDGIVFSLQKYGGISVYFRQLIDYLAKQKDLSTELLLENPLCQEVSFSSDSIHELNTKKRIFERLRRCRTPESASVFHSSYYRTSNKRNIPTVVTVHDFIYEKFRRGPKSWLHARQMHSSIRNAQAVICISNSTYQDLIELVGEVPGQKIYIIHNGVSSKYFPIENTSTVRPYMLYVGERRGYKNFRLVLESMRINRDLLLYCVGGGLLREEDFNGFDSSVVARVEHLGFLSEEELNRYYNGALCLVYPSSYEGFGIPVIEAMRAGCPVVCTNCKAVLEIGHDALQIAEGLDGHAFASAVTELTCADKRATLIKKGLKVASQYSWQSTHEKTLNVYRDLVA